MDQFDKGGMPYLLHVLEVRNILNSPDEELNCIAVLHDIVEDTKTTYQELREAGMSERVIDGVRLLTKVPGQTYDEYVAGVTSSVDAMLVKKADLTHNMDLKRLKGVAPKDMDRMNKYVIFYHLIETRLRNENRIDRWKRDDVIMDALREPPIKILGVEIPG